MPDAVGMLHRLGHGHHHGRSVDGDPTHGRSEPPTRASCAQPAEATRCHPTRRLPPLRPSLCHDP